MVDGVSSPNQLPSSRLDTSVPHSARVWNYWCGGKDNFAADRELGKQVYEVFPGIVEVARASRAFLIRAVSYLAGQAGIRQFLDIGAGLPTANNTHEVAQRLAPCSRVVYVDNDPLVLTHAHGLLTSHPDGATAYIDADVRDPERILAEAARTLDLTQPVGLVLLGIMGNVTDYDQARDIVRRLVDALAPNSHVVLNDGTSSPERDAAEEVGTNAGVPYAARTPEQIAGFFAGLDLVQPGVVSTPLWRPDSDGPGAPAKLDVFCGMAVKPSPHG